MKNTLILTAKSLTCILLVIGLSVLYVWYRIHPSTWIFGLVIATAGILALLVWLWLLKDIPYGKGFLVFAISTIFLGGLMNFVATASNNGYMPVQPELYEKCKSLPNCYICGGNLLVLGDRLPYGFSLGDVIAFIGIVATAGLLIFNVIAAMVNKIAKWMISEPNKD